MFFWIQCLSRNQHALYSLFLLDRKLFHRIQAMLVAQIPRVGNLLQAAREIDNLIVCLQVSPLSIWECLIK